MTLSTPMRLSTDTIFYADPAGSNDDSHGQGTGTDAFADPSYGVSWLCRNVDAACFQVKLQVSSNTFTDQILLGDMVRSKPGGWPVKPLLISGNPADPTNGPLLSVGGTHAISAIASNSAWYIEGFQIQSTVCDVQADFGSRIYVASNIHGPGYPSPQKFAAIYGGKIEILGPCWVHQGGQTLMFSQYHGMILQATQYIYMVNDPGFSSGLVAKDDSSLVVGLSVSGAYH